MLKKTEEKPVASLKPSGGLAGYGTMKVKAQPQTMGSHKKNSQSQLIDTKLKPGQTIGAFNPDRRAFKKYDSSNPEKVLGKSGSKLQS